MATALLALQTALQGIGLNVELVQDGKKLFPLTDKIVPSGDLYVELRKILDPRWSNFPLMISKFREQGIEISTSQLSGYGVDLFALLIQELTKPAPATVDPQSVGKSQRKYEWSYADLISVVYMVDQNKASELIEMFRQNDFEINGIFAYISDAVAINNSLYQLMDTSLKMSSAVPSREEAERLGFEDNDIVVQSDIEDVVAGCLDKAHGALTDAVETLVETQQLIEDQQADIAERKANAMDAKKVTAMLEKARRAHEARKRAKLLKARAKQRVAMKKTATEKDDDEYAAFLAYRKRTKKAKNQVSSDDDSDEDEKTKKRGGRSVSVSKVSKSDPKKGGKSVAGKNDSKKDDGKKNDSKKDDGKKDDSKKDDGKKSPKSSKKVEKEVTPEPSESEDDDMEEESDQSDADEE